MWSTICHWNQNNEKKQTLLFFFFVVKNKIWNKMEIKYFSMPTGFFIWGYMYPFTFIFGGAMYPLTLHLGIQRKLIAFSPRKVVHHAVFCKYYAELAKPFFFWKWGSVWSMVFVSVPPFFFCNVVYNLSNFVFYTELNARLPIYSHDH